VPYGVPNEIVEICTPPDLAARAAVNAPCGALGSSGTFSAPSDSSTMRAGGGPSPPPITEPTVAIACSAVKMPSPVAVFGAGCRLSMPDFTAPRCGVGGTNRVALAANSTNPRLMAGVSWSANCLPASFAAARRVGGTSLEAIDSETSMTSITSARLSGIRTSDVGPAIAVVSSTSDAASRMVGTCRHRLGCGGATRSSTSMLANRSTRRRRANCCTT
jgi:hypothetical protein